MSVVPPLTGPPLYRYIPGVGKVGTTQNGATGPTGPQGSQGIPGTASGTGATGPTGPAGFQSFSSPTGSVLFFSGTTVTGRADFSLTNSTLQIPGNMIPSANNVYSLGVTGARWAEVLVGPGSINIQGPTGFTGSATIGTDAAGLIYTESGIATPKVVIGPSQLTPQAVGGWQIGPTGTQGTAGYALIAQQLQANGSGPTGPIYQLAPNSLTGPTGNTGPTGAAGSAGVTGPTGPTAVPSGFITVNGSTLALTTGYTGISSTTVATTATGYIMGQATIQVANPDNTDHWVDFYITVNGSTGNVTTQNIQRRTGGVNGYQNIALIHRSGLTAPGIWATTLFGRVRDVSSVANVVVDHVDLFTLGHLG